MLILAVTYPGHTTLCLSPRGRDPTRREVRAACADLRPTPFADHMRGVRRLPLHRGLPAARLDAQLRHSPPRHRPRPGPAAAVPSGAAPQPRGRLLHQRHRLRYAPAWVGLVTWSSLLLRFVTPMMSACYREKQSFLPLVKSQRQLCQQSVSCVKVKLLCQ